MIFEIGEIKVETRITDRTVFKSKHTGNDLEKIEIEYSVRRRTSIPDEVKSDDGKMWKVGNSRHSYTEGVPVYNYALELEEQEKLDIDKLILDDIELEPYLFEEEAKKDGLLITARVKVIRDTWNKIIEITNRENIYFPVIRQGISTEPVEMRFGKIIYSENEEEVKFRIILVEKVEDDKRLGIFQPELPNMKTKIIQNLYGFEELVQILKEKDMLSEEDIHRLNKIRDEVNTFSNIIMVFNVVNDLDEFLDGTDA